MSKLIKVLKENAEKGKYKAEASVRVIEKPVELTQEEKIQWLIDKEKEIERRLWMLENPPRYSIGDELVLGQTTCAVWYMDEGYFSKDIKAYCNIYLTSMGIFREEDLFHGINFPAKDHPFGFFNSRYL